MNVTINTPEDLQAVITMGFHPLVDRRFSIAHDLRVEIQRELFGKGHSIAENERFYKWVWKHKAHICEECLKPLETYSAVHVSHILARGAYPEMAHDPRNTNILCLECHNRWENGNRRSMRIYEGNQIVIAELKKEYSCI